MTYSVHEIFYTLQGEGANAGRPAVFCRFSGCNLWSGRETDRATAICKFCDTHFVGTNGTDGGKFDSAQLLATKIEQFWPADADTQGSRLVVLTGGEPLLQVDEPLIHALHALGFEIAVESNGTIAPPDGIDWLCVSPKANTKLVASSGQELKLVFPQAGLSPLDFETLRFEHFFLQPMDGPQARENLEKSIRFCLEHPQWRLSLQTHKMIGIR